MTTTKILKNQKPIDSDIHLKYRCPKPKCGLEHWLSLKEAKTKNFKIVCDCGLIFQPKPIKNVRVSFKRKRKSKTRLVEPSQEPNTNSTPEKVISPTVQKYCVDKLIGYGFTNVEALTFVSNAHNKFHTSDPILLLKYILQNLGDLNESH